MDIEIAKLGAVNDGSYINTSIIQKAIDECSASGGGRVIISGGTYVTGKLILKSNVNLHIASDGVLKGAAEYEHYPETENVSHVDSLLLPRTRNACLIFADECENISITGNGAIDCNGDKYVVPIEGNPRRWTYKRIDTLTPPRAVFFTGCKNIKVEDIAVINLPAGWGFWIHDCDYVTFDKVKVIADVHYPNNDGIHVNCSRNVTISNCSIICGDDCIVVRANSVSLKENKVCEKVVVTNCNLTSHASGIRIGWINDGVIRNCAFSNIIMTETVVGIYMVLPYKKFGIQNFTIPDPIVSTDVGREYTLIENISFNNVIMDNIDYKPIVIKIDNHSDVHCKGIRNIYFSNLHAKGHFPDIQGREDCHLSNIHFSDCTFEVAKSDEPPCMTMRYADNLHFNNINFTIDT